MKKLLSGMLVLMFFAGSLLGQEEYPFPSLSPKGTLSQVVGNTTISIEYERPAARKRQVFGGLVPWDEVWRTGAGHCTKVSFDRPVVVGGQAVAPGTYSLFTIPNRSQWVVILNKDTTLYGSYGYDAKKDVARFIALPKMTTRYYETLTLDIDLLPNDARLYISWANTQVAFDIQTTTDAEMAQFIQEQLLSGKHTNTNFYAGAAEYYLYQGTNFFDAIVLTDKALAIAPENGWARDLKIRLYERIKRYPEALQAAEDALQMVKNAKYDNEQERRQELQSFEKHITRLKRKMD
jgi:hypothetical protein